MKKFKYISLKKYSADDEEYKKFVRLMKRFPRPKEGRVTLNGENVYYKHTRRNNWMIQVERTLEEIEKANTRYRENQRKTRRARDLDA